MSDNLPLVSIITITRNRGNLINRAIESVLKQTYTKFEYIVVDGASEDNTKEVVNLYCDHRIKYIELQENYPIIQTLNIGFENSLGEFITFLDDDDEYLPTKIEKQLNLIQKLPEKYGFVYCWMSYFDDKTKKFLYTHKTELRGNVASEVVESPTISGTPTYFFRRYFFEKLGGWKEDIGIVSDWELAARACQNSLVDYVPDSLVNVYVNHGLKRLSDPGYYNKTLEKQIKFHFYFLTEFSEVFEKYPTKKAGHLYAITRAYFFLNQWAKGIYYYKMLLKVNSSLKNLALPFYCLLKRKKLYE